MTNIDEAERGRRAEFESWRAKQAERERVILEAVGEAIAKIADEIVDRFEEHSQQMRTAVLDAVEARFAALEAQIKVVESHAKGTFQFNREKGSSEIEDLPNRKVN
jgi:hypothetical protein